MQKEKNISTQEVISMEEYLNKRQKIREQEKKRFGGSYGSSAEIRTGVRGIFGRYGKRYFF